MTMQNISISIDKNYVSISEWLQNLLLPADEQGDSPTIKSIKTVMRSWNAAEVADATASIIYKAVTDENGNADMDIASLFTDSEIIQLGVSLRRGSRIDAIRNREKLGLAWAALHETIRIVLKVMTARDFWVVAEPQDFDGLAYDYEQGVDESFAVMLDNEETFHNEIQDSLFEQFTKPDTRDLLHRLDILYGKLNRIETDRHRSKRNRKAVVDSRAVNAMQRRPSLRKEIGA